MIYKVYTGTKPPPKWLKIIGSVAFTLIVFGFAAGGWMWIGARRIACLAQQRARQSA